MDVCVLFIFIFIRFICSHMGPTWICVLLLRFTPHSSNGVMHRNSLFSVLFVSSSFFFFGFCFSFFFFRFFFFVCIFSTLVCPRFTGSVCLKLTQNNYTANVVPLVVNFNQKLQLQYVPCAVCIDE